MTGVFVFPLTPYLQTLRLEKDALVQALGISFTLCTLLMALTLGGGAPLVFGLPGALALANALAGMARGARLRGRIDGRRFQQVCSASSLRSAS